MDGCRSPLTGIYSNEVLLKPELTPLINYKNCVMGKNILFKSALYGLVFLLINY
jgi:hypothetical protein